MGWKTFKQRFGIEAIVHIENGCVCVGLTADPRLLIVTPEGQVPRDHTDVVPNPNLRAAAQRVRDLSRSNPQLLSSLVAQADAFEVHCPVFSVKAGELVVQHCESFGPGLPTHCGELMRADTHFLEAMDAWRAAKHKAAEQLERLRPLVHSTRQRLLGLEEEVLSTLRALERMESPPAYPGMPSVRLMD